MFGLRGCQCIRVVPSTIPVPVTDVFDLTTHEWFIFWSFYGQRLSQVLYSFLSSSLPLLKTLAACQGIRPCICVAMCGGMCDFTWDVWRTSGLLWSIFQPHHLGLKCIYTEESPIIMPALLTANRFKAYAFLSRICCFERTFSIEDWTSYKTMIINIDFGVKKSTSTTSKMLYR